MVIGSFSPNAGICRYPFLLWRFSGWKFATVDSLQKFHSIIGMNLPDNRSDPFLGKSAMNPYNPKNWCPFRKVTGITPIMAVERRETSTFVMIVKNHYAGTFSYIPTCKIGRDFFRSKKYGTTNFVLETIHTS
jgi:hypothetical protein